MQPNYQHQQLYCVMHIIVDCVFIYLKGCVKL